MAEKPTPSTEVVHPLTGQVMPTPPDYLQGLRVILDSDDISEESFERILNASSPEEALFNPAGEGLEKHTGETIIVLSVDGIQPSTVRDHEDEYYLRFTAQTSKGIMSMTTGSDYAGRQIVKLGREGWLPRRVMAFELVGKKDPSRTSLWIVDRGTAVAGTEVDPAF